MFSADVLAPVKRIKPSFRNELEITDAIQDLIDHGLEVRPHLVQGWWKDTGKLEDMLEANRIVLDTLDKGLPPKLAGCSIEGRVEIGEGAEIIDSVVRGPVILGAGARVEHAFIGPYTSIGDRCKITRCEIENSIVLADSEIRDVPLRIDGSLIGRNVKIVKTDIKPKAYRFMVGDNSEVGVS